MFLDLPFVLPTCVMCLMSAVPINVISYKCFCLLQEKACESFEVFDEMLECEVVIITPHLKSAVMFCLEVSG